MRFAGLGLMFLVGLNLVGCGGENPQITGARVTGVVKYQQKLVTGGEIRFVDVLDMNKSMSGRIDADGRFDVPNVPTGKVKVMVDTNAARYDISAMGSKAGGDIDAGMYGKPVKYMKIPDKYAGFESTDYVIELKKGDQEVEIDLK